MIGIIDYGLGNVQAFATAYKRLGMAAQPVRFAKDLGDCNKIILPGVGAFDHAIKQFTESGMRDAVVRRAEAGTPLLGVCVGMQMLAESSAEGDLSGLGLIKGRVEHLSTLPEAMQLPLPHMGWNSVTARSGALLFDDHGSGSDFYFLHSFYLRCSQESEISASVVYGTQFCCAVERGNVFGVQFHPEKSHHSGVRLLKRFGEM